MSFQEIEAFGPTTASQREIWAACQLGDDASLAYNESVTLTIAGPIDGAAMLRALVSLRARHEALRMTFSEDGESFVVSPVGETGDRLLPAGADLEALRREAVGQPFDLAQGPLFRAVVLPGAAVSHVIFTAHHLVCDGWSTAILIRDLSRLYSAAVGMPSEELPARQLFTEFVTQRLAYAEDPAAKADVDYWVDQFATVPPMDIPHDRARPKSRSFPSRRIDVDLPAATLAGLKKLGAKEGASLFMGLLAAYKVLLWKILDDEIVVAVPAAAQAENGWYDLVGHCVNVMPLKSRPQADQSFRSLLRQVKSLVLDGSEHQGCAYGSILERLPLDRDPSRIPFAPVIFNVDRKFDMSDIAFGGLDATYDSNPRAFEAFEMFHNITEANGHARLECQFNTDLYSAHWIESHLASFVALLTNLVQTPEAPLSEIGWAPTAQLETQYFTWNSRNLDVPAPHFLALFDEAAAARPDRIACKGRDGSLSYAALLARSNRWARLLAAEGVTRGSRVGIALERSTEMLAALLGIMKAGATYIPLDPTYPEERLAYMAEHSETRVIITESGLAQRLPIPKGCRALLVDDADRLLRPLAADTPACQALIEPEDVAYVIYTSGSTGKPKGVVCHHGGVVNLLCSMQQTPGLASDDKLLAVTTLSFDMSVLELYLPLVVGATVVIATGEEAKDASALAEIIASEKITVMQATPATWRLLVESDWRGAPLVAFTGGEALASDLAEKLLARVTALWNLYGPTEITVYATGRRITDPRTIDIGGAIHNTTLYVLDRFKQPVPWGIPGELHIGGAGVTAGYLGQPELTRERFFPLANVPDLGLVYKTGDLVRFTPEGDVHYCGRNDNQVKVRGFRIELGEIEAVLAQAAGVNACVVMVREDRPGDQRLVAYCESAQSPATLTQWLRDHLPAYMVPQHVITLDQMPLLPNGKINRKSLPSPSLSLAGAPAVAGNARPKTPLEEQIAAVWRELLVVADVPTDASFFALGGHSLLAVRMLQTLQKLTGKAITLRLLLEGNTVEALARAIESGNQAKLEPIAKVTNGKEGKLSIMQDRVYFLDKLEPGDCVHVLPDARYIRGDLKVDLFLGAVRTLIGRHPQLRARFIETGNGPVSVIDDIPQWSDQVIDLSTLPAAEQEAVLDRESRAIASVPMDVAKDTLFRLKLYKLADHSYALGMAFHHLVWDGWCFDVFWTELHTLYHAALRGETPALPALGADYLDFAVWHRDASRAADVQRQLPFWKDYLEGLQLLELPTDHPRPARRSSRGSRLEFKWTPELIASLEAIGRSEGTTAAVVMLALFKYLLARHAGQHDVQVGMPVQGRGHGDVANVIGYFVNTLVVRTRLDDALTFRQWVGTVKTSLEAAMRHQDAPFEDIVRSVDVRADPSRTTLYTVMFGYQDTSNRRSEWHGIELKQFSLPQESVGSDLMLWMRKNARGVEGGFDFRTELFGRERIASLIDDIDFLAKAVAQNPSIPLGDMTWTAHPVTVVEPSVRTLDVLLPADATIHVDQDATGRDHQRWLTLARASGRRLETHVGTATDGHALLVRMKTRSSGIAFLTLAEAASLVALDWRCPQDLMLVVGVSESIPCEGLLAALGGTALYVVSKGDDQDGYFAWARRSASSRELLWQPIGAAVEAHTRNGCRIGSWMGELAPGGLKLWGRSDAREVRGGLLVKATEQARQLAMSPELLYVHTNDVATLVVASPRRHDELALVESQLRRRIPAYLLPTKLLVADHLPLSATGDVDERSVEAAASREIKKSIDLPRTHAEKRLAAIWSQVLGVETIDRRDNFFDLGGHSLLPLLVINQIESETGKRLDVGLFLTQTLAALAAHCGFHDDGESVGIATVVDIAPAASLPAKAPKPTRSVGWKGLLGKAFGERRNRQHSGQRNNP